MQENKINARYLFLVSETLHTCGPCLKMQGLGRIVAFRKLLSIYVFSYFPFGFEGMVWDLIVSVPVHCLSFYFVMRLTLQYVRCKTDLHQKDQKNCNVDKWTLTGTPACKRVSCSLWKIPKGFGNWHRPNQRIPWYRRHVLGVVRILSMAQKQTEAKESIKILNHYQNKHL